MSASPVDGDVFLRELAGGAVPDQEGLAQLAGVRDILTLGMLADDRRRSTRGTETTFVRVQVWPQHESAGTARLPAAREVMVLAPPEQAIGVWPGVFAAVAAAAGVPVTAGDVSEIERLAARGGPSLRETVERLRDAGVSAISELPIDVVSEPERAMETIRSAGLDVARLTVSQHLDATARVAMWRRVRQVIAAVGPLRSVAPLGRRWNPDAPSTGFDDIRTVAATRLLLPPETSIQVDWTLYGPKLAQVALTVGADDLDGVTAHDEAPDGRRRAPLEEVLRNVRAAGLVPVERDGGYRRIGA